MAVFRFHLIGAPPVELEVAARDISDLSAMMACHRFVEGRLTEAESDGVLAGVLLATSRIQCVVESGG